MVVVVIVIIEAVVSVLGMVDVVDMKRSLLPVGMSDVIVVDVGHPLIEADAVADEAFGVRSGSLGTAVGVAAG